MAPSAELESLSQAYNGLERMNALKEQEIIQLKGQLSQLVLSTSFNNQNSDDNNNHNDNNDNTTTPQVNVEDSAEFKHLQQQVITLEGTLQTINVQKQELAHQLRSCEVTN